MFIHEERTRGALRKEQWGPQVYEAACVSTRSSVSVVRIHHESHAQKRVRSGGLFLHVTQHHCIRPSCLKHTWGITVIPTTLRT